MKIAKFARRSALFLSMLVLLAACGGGGGGGGGAAGGDGSTGDGGGGEGADNAKAEFTLTAFDRDGLQTGGLLGLNQLSRLLGGADLTRVSGAILAVAQGTGDVSGFQYQLDIDATGFSIPTDVPMDLPPGQYDFYFLMSASNGRQYAGVSKNWTILPVNAEVGERNVVSFLVHPVIGETIPDAETLRSLAEFQFDFGNLAINEWDDPTFGIKVDGSDENRYSINAATGFSQAFVYLPAGQYTFEVRFYDGEELVVIPIVIVVDITEEGGSVDVDVVPIDIVNNVTPEGESTTMNLVISGKAIDDAGGPGNISAVFSLRDDESLQFEQKLTLSKDGESYEATVAVPGLQPGFMTWAVQMSNTQGGTETPYAWCAQTIQLAAGAQTLICTLRVADAAPAWLRVIARMTGGTAVEGAIVIANGEPIGITGNGDGGTVPGQLKIFLPEGTYEAVALHPLLGQSGVQQVTLTEGQTVEAEFEFIPDDQTAPVVTITSPAGNTNNPEPALQYSIVDESPVQVKVWLAAGSQAAEEIGTRNNQELGPLDDGSYTVTVEATDQAGNEGSDSVSFTVDSNAPGLSIISPVNGSLINTAAPNLVLLSGDTGTVTVQIDGGAETNVGVTAGVQKSVPLSALADGPHSIEAYQEDGSGNESSAMTEFTVDTHAPVVEIVSPPGETEDHEPLLEYTTDEEGGTEAVFLDGQPVKTRSGDYLPWLADGSHTVKVEVTDLAGNKGSDSVDVEIVSPPPIHAFELDAFYYKRPRERVDDKVFVEGKVKVRIPDQEAIQVITGNPDRYLLYLRLGEVHCLYLGGGANAHFGGLEWHDVEWFRQFKSPVCGLGKYRAGDEVIVQKSIYMRILFADPKFDETHIKVFLDITGEGEVTEDDGDRHHRHHWRWWRHHDRRDEWRSEDDGKWWFDRGRWRDDDDRDDDDRDHGRD